MRRIYLDHNAATPLDPQVAEYTAIIEADMERYQYTENIETLDLTAPQKKRK